MKLNKKSNTPQRNYDRNPLETNVEDRMTHISEKKRSRQTSSLDIKVYGGSEMTTPPLKNTNNRQTRGAPKDHQYQRKVAQIAGIRQGRVQSRRNYDGMDDEDLLQALYDDPELMAAAAASRQAKKEPRTKKSKVNEYPDHIKSMMDEGVPVTQWIIVLVLLGAGIYQLRKSLVGPSTNASSAAKAVTRKTTERGMGRKTGKQKGKKNTIKTKGKVNNKSSHSIIPPEEQKEADAVSLIEEELIALEPLVQKKKARNKSASKKSRRRRDGKSSNSTDNTVGDDVGSHESPDSVSTDGSSSTENVPQPEEDRGMMMANLTEESQLSPEEMRVDSEGWQTMANDNEGWQTVGSADKNRRKNGVSKVSAGDTHGTKEVTKDEAEPVNETATPDVDNGENDVEECDSADAVPAPLDMIEATEEVGEQTETEQKERAPLEKETESKEAAPSKMKNEAVPATALTVSPNNGSEGSKTAQTGKKKKSKKKKKTGAQNSIENESLAKQNGGIGTDDDEALAFRLQQEEEKLAMTPPVSEPAPVEEVWEEVSKAKKKKKAPTVSVE